MVEETRGQYIDRITETVGRTTVVNGTAVKGKDPVSVAFDFDNTLTMTDLERLDNEGVMVDILRPKMFQIIQKIQEDGGSVKILTSAKVETVLEKLAESEEIKELMRGVPIVSTRSESYQDRVAELLKFNDREINGRRFDYPTTKIPAAIDCDVIIDDSYSGDIYEYAEELGFAGIYGFASESDIEQALQSIEVL